MGSAALVYALTLTKSNRQLASSNAELRTEIEAAKHDNQAIKENKIQKYSAKNLTLASTSSVANINTFLRRHSNGILPTGQPDKSERKSMQHQLW